jgi:hypothetical protein
MTRKMRRTSTVTTRIDPLKFCISCYFFDMKALLVVILLLKIQYLNHPKPKSKPIIQNPCFELQLLQQILIQCNTKIMDGKNDLNFQSSISMIVKTEDICPEYPRNLPRKSLKSAQKIPEIYSEHPRNLFKTFLKYVRNVLGTANKSPRPQWSPQKFG